MNKYILDTSALFAYIENEEGSSELQTLLSQALDDKILVFISIVSCIELFYISLQEQGDKIAKERLSLINNLPLIQENLDQSLIQIIGEIKAQKTMSFADCCIAGLAMSRDAILVHKDPEYEQIEKEVKQLKLPFNKKHREPK